MKYVGILLSLLFVLHCDKSVNTINKESNTNYQLCYQKQDSNYHWQIFVNNISGTTPKNISNNPSDDAIGPLWSPDGRYIAFRYDRENSGGCDIYLYEVNSNKKINITSDLTVEESAYPVLWSPDSKKLIYNYHKIGEPFYYYIMNSDGTEKQKLFETEWISIIDFCDEGNSILYTENQILYKINITSRSVELILNFTDMNIYSIWVDDYEPISNTILCHEDSSSWDAGATFLIKKINLNLLEMDTLVTAEKDIILLRPVFSNDYSKVAYIERDYVNDISKIILLEHGEKTELNRLTDENERYGIYKIQFSPNDSYITYTVSANIPSDWISNKSYVYVSNISTKEARLIDQAEDSHWNPLNNF